MKGLSIQALDALVKVVAEIWGMVTLVKDAVAAVVRVVAMVAEVAETDEALS